MMKLNSNVLSGSGQLGIPTLFTPQIRLTAVETATTPTLGSRILDHNGGMGTMSVSDLIFFCVNPRPKNPFISYCVTVCSKS